MNVKGVRRTFAGRGGDGKRGARLDGAVARSMSSERPRKAGRMLEIMMKAFVASVALMAAAGLGACSEGSSEKAGENLDSAVENATQGHEDKGDGALEKAGEAIDNATGAERNDGADALSDATDGDKSTKP